jgi:Cd2+/Zn2+-exporting ATPase
MAPASPELLFTIRGMDCAGCARSIEGGVAQLPGVEHCELNFTTERLRVSGTASRESVAQRVRDLGYDVAEEAVAGVMEAPRETTAPRASGFLAYLWSRGETRLALLGALLILPGLLLHELLGVEAPWLDGLAVAAMLVTAPPIARSAWRGLWVGRELNINALMTIAALGALLIGAYVEAGMVMVLFAIGEARP